MISYREFHIWQHHTGAWRYEHPEYDGPEDQQRSGSAHTCVEAMHAIDALHDNPPEIPAEEREAIEHAARLARGW